MHWKTVKTVCWSAVGGALVWWIVLKEDLMVCRSRDPLEPGST